MHQAARILIVEDEFLIAMELEDTLLSAGYQVVGPAPSIREALRLLRAARPDAAVLDVNVAGQWVTPVAEMLRTMVVPFILASGYRAADLDAMPVLREAVNIGKPYRPERLLMQLRDLLRSAGP